MSNEWKDYLWDAAQEYLFNKVYLIKEIEYMTEYDYGYLIIGKHTDGSRGVYFVWIDEDYGWNYKSIYV